MAQRSSFARARAKRSAPPPSPRLASASALRAAPHESWRADNEYIEHGYRVDHGWRAACASFLSLHNETVNVWSHALGFLLFLSAAAVAGAQGSRALADAAAFSDRRGGAMMVAGGDAAIVLYCLCAALCMGVSAVFHLFHIVDFRVFTLLARLDYAFISVLIWGSTMPVLYLAFHCDAASMLTHGVLITATNLAAATCSMMDAFHQREWRIYRASIFSAAGLMGIVPFLHLAALGSSLGLGARAGILLTGGLYLGGAFLYGLRIPERSWPGAFDTFGASHQIFHICVFLAAYVHLDTLLVMLEQRHLLNEC